jgi:predicted transcriptional regulator of viral defense system
MQVWRLGILRCHFFMEKLISCSYSVPMSSPQPPGASQARSRFSLVLRKSGDLISIADATAALSISRPDAAKLLARWNAQGWIKRLRRGLYAPVPIASLGQEQVLEDPWVMVPELFGPACIGGWSAAEHWGLTEQLFRSTCVLTARVVRRKEVTVQGLPFSLKHVQKRALFGTRPVWRGQARVLVSGPAKTIIDMLDDPAIGGGIRHVADCLRAYLARKDANANELIEAAETLGNGAVFKRLGFLAEAGRGQEALVTQCRERLTAGNARLDPAFACRRLIKRWRLWVPAGWSDRKGG